MLNFQSYDRRNHSSSIEYGNMRVLIREDKRAVALYSDTHSLVFRQLLEKANATLESSVAVELISNQQITQESGFRALIRREVHGCLGLITLDGQIFVVIITGAIKEVSRPMPHETVDKIYSVDFISLTNDEWDYLCVDGVGIPLTGTASNPNEESEERQVHPGQELKKLMSNGSFYYSNDFDLTSLLQDRLSALNVRDERKYGIDTDTYLKDYMWNLFILEDLLNFRSNLEDEARLALDQNNFLTYAIRGYAQTVPVEPRGDSMTIISKQSWKRAGTRFNVRGIDDNGSVANFVETEIIYYGRLHGSISSFTQVRGSVPAFWEQDSTLINPKITITRSVEATQPVFDTHFNNLQLKFDTCHIVNLLSKTKPAEASLLRRYHELYSHYNQRGKVPFTDFDFHYETKQSGGFSGAAKILPLLERTLAEIGWFSYDLKHEQTITRQTGVIRDNCLDCLDRTNLIQQVVSQDVLSHILINPFNSSRDDYRQRALIDEIVARHNTIWADNGDAISQIYTGTNALKSSYTRLGKMNFAGALSDVTKSVSRMYQNTFVDGKKQNTMDMLLGYDVKNTIPVRIYDPINEYVSEKLQQCSKQFTKSSEISVFIGTFNVSAATPTNRTDLSQWLFPPESDSTPDIFAIGIQELIELNAGSILTADVTKSDQWASKLNTQLKASGEEYLLLRTEAISSLALFLFVKKDQITSVTQVAGVSKKTGLGGIAANKGACAVRFNFGLTSIALVTCHLAAGTNATAERNADYETIMQGLKFTRNYTLPDHSHIIWFGDLNYRINLPNEKCRRLIDGGAFDELLDRDELTYEIRHKGAFRDFTESNIRFYPTYKFDKGTSNYDSSEKQRVPSWTDRVLHTSNADAASLKPLAYSSVMNICISDHKPVFSLFKCEVNFVDETKRSQLAKQLYNNYKAKHGDQVNGSLLEFSDSNSSRPSLSSKGSNFTADTLSEMNILDSIDLLAPGPKVPLRPASRSAVPPLPRRAPTSPVPAQTTEKPSSSAPVTVSNGIPPPAPGPRRVVQNAPIGFSNAPLTPSRTSSTSRGSPISAPEAATQAPRKPLVPTKPHLLSTAISESNIAPASEPEPPKRPLPSAPPHASATNIAPDNENNQEAVGKSLSDWAPLVPK